MNKAVPPWKVEPPVFVLEASGLPPWPRIRVYIFMIPYPARERKGQVEEHVGFRDTRPFFAYMPENLDLATVTRTEWCAYAAWVVSSVVFRRYIDRDADEATFVPLASRYIDEHVPAKVRRPLLDDLLKAGVLECDEIYFFSRDSENAPGKCLCYRLGADYRGVRITPRPVSHPELLRKISTAKTKEREKVVEPVHLALREWHDRVEVTADAPYSDHPLLDRMIDGERRFTVCRQGRVHTNVANLPAQYRQFLRLAGRGLESVDISTSQPLLLAILTCEEIPSQRTREGKTRPPSIMSSFL